MEKSNDLCQALVSLKEDEVKELVKKYIEAGKSPKEIVLILQEGLIEIGNKFEKEEYFVPELMYGAEIAKVSIKPLESMLKGKELKTKGKVILGTVFGDIHNIGKDLVGMLLEGDGFEVINLGENVNPSKFVKAIEENEVKLLGLSALLTMSFGAITNTVKTIEESGLRDRVKIMVGGAPVTELVREKTGCDFYGKDAFEGVKYARKVYNHQ